LLERCKRFLVSRELREQGNENLQLLSPAETDVLIRACGSPSIANGGFPAGILPECIAVGRAERAEIKIGKPPSRAFRM
jgi:hypothetical protein